MSVAAPVPSFFQCLAVVASGYWLVAWWAARRFFRGLPRVSPAFFPVVSILKPVKGVDARAAENFAGFCRQDYPSFEILFGVADENDPAVEVIGQLRAQFPSVSIRLVVAPRRGMNPKTSTLIALEAEARGDVLVLSDADIRVEPNYLREVISPLKDQTVGIVTCPYRGAAATTLAAKLESLHMGLVFLPSAVVAHEVMGGCVGMGATLALRKADLLRLGGFEAFADHLMDDYQLAERVRKLGLRSVLSRHVVASVLGPTKFADQWKREVRWARGIRVTTPGQYPGLLLTYPLAWAALAAVVRPTSPLAWALLAVTLVLRTEVSLDLIRLYGNDGSERKFLHLLPLRELMSVAVWVAGCFGRTVTWRGQRFELRRDGTLTPAGRRHGGLIGVLVRRLDARLRRGQGIFEFTDEPNCLLRVSVGACEKEIELADGTRLMPGDLILHLHLWNERLPAIPPEGPGMGWAHHTMTLARASLRLLAVATERDPRLSGAKAVLGRSVFTPRGGDRQLRRMAMRLGLELRTDDNPVSIPRRLHDTGENLLIWALVHTFNPGGLRGAKFVRRRAEVWMSREALRKNYGGGDSIAFFPPDDASNPNESRIARPTETKSSKV